MADKYGIKYYECFYLNGLIAYEIINNLILEGYYGVVRKEIKSMII